MSKKMAEHNGTKSGSIRKRSRGGVEHVALAREVFWQNVAIEMLTTLAMVAHDEGEDGEPAFADGRFAVVTKLGQRIPIGVVSPLMACSVSSDRSLSADVQCSVFQITSPTGEVYTMPVHEIAGFHAVRPEMLEMLQQLARKKAGLGGGDEPFGFEAFTSLAKSHAEEGEEEEDVEEEAGG